MNHHDNGLNFDGPLIGKYVAKGSLDELGRRITSSRGWVDGGDTTQRVGMYHAGLAAYERVFGKPAVAKYIKDHQLLYADYNDFKKAEEKLDAGPGNYIRHPDQDFWYSGKNVMSRDQMFPMLATMAIKGDKRLLRKFFWGHFKRALLFTTNTRRNGSTIKNHGKPHWTEPEPLSKWDKFVLTRGIPLFNSPKGWRNYNWKLPDITGPSIWALYIRGFRIWWLYPLLCLLDLEYVINSFIIRKNKNDFDTVNHSVEVATTCVYPTPATWFANTFINSATDLIKRSAVYFLEKGNPYFIDYLYRPILKRLLRE